MPDKFKSRKLLLVFLFCTGTAIATLFMIYMANSWNEIFEAVKMGLEKQIWGIGTYVGGNAVNNAFNSRNQ